MAKSSKYVVCETMAAITLHLRLRADGEIRYVGGLKVKTLCGMQAAWDTKHAVEDARCTRCIALKKE